LSSVMENGFWSRMAERPTSLPKISLVIVL
jgi:hypothetical protein